MYENVVLKHQMNQIQFNKKKMQHLKHFKTSQNSTEQVETFSDKSI